MKDDQSSPAGGVNRFQTTRWSVVLVSAQSQAPGYRQALADLCKLYCIGFLKKQIHRLRKQYTATLREEISRTVSDSADVDTETHDLCEALIAAEGWVIP